MTSATDILSALRTMADDVSAKMSQLTPGAPEDQLRAPFETFMVTAARAMGVTAVCTGETPLPDRLGRPDYGVHVGGLLAGYVELKAPGTGAVVSRFAGHNRAQWKRFSAIPNLLYTDGNEWALYRSGALVGRVARLSGDVATGGGKAVDDDDATHVTRVLRDFLSWKPITPTHSDGRIDLMALAELLAPLCRMLRDDVADALEDPSSPLVQLAADWRQLLFPDAPDSQFADAYAQTVTFALLLGRSEGARPLTLETAEAALTAHHSLLSRALQVLTDPSARSEMAASLNMLLRVVAAVPAKTLRGPEDPWLYFYEDFLASYDPVLRRDVGAYYTPIEVVRAQVRLIDDVLVNRFGKAMGFADPDVVTLDPAAGTGTYLLGAIEHALNRVADEHGPGAVPGSATTMAANLYGFEIMVGPYAVTELRVTRALRDRGAELPKAGTHIYLTDTLENPHATPPQLPLFLRPIAEQHARALKVKSEVPVIVCLGNPPYDRHEAATADNKARTGGWVRWGDDGEGGRAVLEDFLQPVRAAGHGGQLKNLYNLYVYFWRWALWKVFEHVSAVGPGIVSYISASSYLDGLAFGGMREHLRKLCDEVWILDLGGEGRGTRQSENVFAIQTPVAIAVIIRGGQPNTDEPAAVRYARLDGTRAEKLSRLESLHNLADLAWQDCPDEWQAPFRPTGRGEYFGWPLLTDLMPWQHSGAQAKRTWPICADHDTLITRWRRLLNSSDRARALKQSRDRKVSTSYPALVDSDERQTPLSQLTADASAPPIRRYAYRSFDRQWILADARLGDFLRPVLWRAHSKRQVYRTSLLNHPLADGPALTASALIPDLHHFRGSYGAKHVLPLYRTADASEPNMLPGLLDLLTKTYDRQVTPEDFVAYVYGALAQPAFTERFEAQLGTRQLRVPLTKEPTLFERVRATGARLLWLHTYGARCVPSGTQPDQVPSGAARCTKAVPGDADGYPESFRYDAASSILAVGQGEFAPVTPEVYEFEVSGLKVVQSWLRYRMKKGAGRKSSPLDHIRPERWTSQFTTELLELLWVLEATVEGYPKQATLLEAVVSGPCFREDELPDVPNYMRKPPRTSRARRLFEYPDRDRTRRERKRVAERKGGLDPTDGDSEGRLS